jgi:PTS system nitrogen regulatory IIA component
MAEAMTTILAELIGPDRIFETLRVADKPALLAELARRAGAALGLPPATISASLAAREMLGSTGVGGGIALPHARLEGLAGLAGFFARLDRPIDFAAIDARPVDLVFLLLSPAGGPAAHLAALAAVSRRLRDRAVIAAIREAPGAAALRTALTGG